MQLNFHFVKLYLLVILWLNVWSKDLIFATSLSNEWFDDLISK